MNERPPASLEASYRKLTITQGDLDAVLVEPLEPDAFGGAGREWTALLVAQPRWAAPQLVPRGLGGIARQLDVCVDCTTASSTTTRRV